MGSGRLRIYRPRCPSGALRVTNQRSRQGLKGVAQAVATAEPDRAARLLGTAAMVRQT